jgi:predicted small secreted protein
MPSAPGLSGRFTTKGTVMKLKIWVLLGAIALAGCNTMDGVGKDMERGGEKIQDQSQKR